MDFHSLPRRDLQALCKKNKIPANLTNVAMADALKSLKSIEWDEEIKQKLMPQSETVEQQHGSPLPRSRRVTARSNDTSGFPMEEMPDKEETKEAFIEANQTPSTALRRSQRIQSAMSTKTRARTSASDAGTATRTSATPAGTVTRTSATPAGTRTRKGKKEEAPAEAVEVMAAATPVPQRGRKKAMETPAKVLPTPATHRCQKKSMETPTQVPVARSSARPTRQSTRRLAGSTKGSRDTRNITNIISLDVNDDQESQAVAEKVEEKEEQSAADLQDVLEVNERLPELNLDTEGKGDADEVSEESEPAKELSEDVDLVKEEELVSNEILNLMEHNAKQIESTEENIEVGFEIDEVIPISEEKDEITQDKSSEEESEGFTEENFNSKMSEKETSTEKSEDAVEEKSNSSVSFVFDSEIPTEKIEETEGRLNSEEKDDVSVEQPVEEYYVVESGTNVAPISDEVQETSTEKSEDAVEEKSNSCVSFVFDSEIPTDKIEETEGRLNSEEKDDVSVKQPVQEDYVVKSDTNVAPISDEVQVIEGSKVNQATQVDSPIMGLVAEFGPENNSDIQDAPLSHITIDAQVAPSDSCFSSPVREQADTGIERMLDSVVRRFAKASIKDSVKKTESCCVVQKEEAVKIASDTPGLVQNENVVKDKLDLNSMSLRKLKALYKDRLIEVNTKKVAEEGKRLPLGKLDENLLV